MAARRIGSNHRHLAAPIGRGERYAAEPIRSFRAFTGWMKGHGEAAFGRSIGQKVEQARLPAESVEAKPDFE